MYKRALHILPLILASLAMLLMCSCNLNSKRVQITIKENNTYYQFKAKFNSSKTELIKTYVQSRLKYELTAPIEETIFREKVTLKDGTEFSMKISSGRLHIKLYKLENTEAAYFKIKSLCDEIKLQIEQL